MEVRSLVQVKFNNEVVMTTKTLAECYKTTEKNIQMNFANNKDRFIEGKHFYRLSGVELKEFISSLPKNIGQPLKFAPELILWTKKGASRHCKMLGTDIAWEVFDILEDTYFRVEEQRRIPQTYAEALRAYADEVEESERLKAENEKQKLLLAEQQPKIEVYDTTMSTDGLLSFKQVADIIAIKGLGRNKLMEFLRSRGILLDKSNKNRPAGKYVDAGYFKEVIVTYDNGYGKNNNTTTTYVTPEGLAFIISQVNKHYVTKSKKANIK